MYWYIKVFKVHIIPVIIFWDFLMSDKTFLSLKVKRSMIFSNKDGVCEFPHEFLNELSLRILGNYKRSGKSENFIELWSSPQSFSQKIILSILSKNSWKMEIELFLYCAISHETTVCLNILSMFVSANSFLLATHPRPLQT